MIKRQADTMQEHVGCILSMSKTIANIGNKTDRPDQDRRPGRQDRRPTVLTEDRPRTVFKDDPRQNRPYDQENRRPKYPRR